MDRSYGIHNQLVHNNNEGRGDTHISLWIGVNNARKDAMLVAEMNDVQVKDIAALPGFFVQTALEGITILCILFKIRAL